MSFEASRAAAPIATDASTDIADEALMLAYQAGDAAAFERLYRRHKDALYRFLLRGCGNRALAEEMAQDVWLNLIRARAGYAPSARFTTWLYHVAHNRLIDGYRRQRHGVELDETLADEGAGPEQEVERRARARQLRQALRVLPLEQRAAFLLHEESGLSLEEIAHVTGVGRETVKSRLRYALEKLRRALADA